MSDIEDNESDEEPVTGLTIQEKKELLFGSRKTSTSTTPKEERNERRASKLIEARKLALFGEATQQPAERVTPKAKPVVVRHNSQMRTSQAAIASILESVHAPVASNTPLSKSTASALPDTQQKSDNSALSGPVDVKTKTGKNRRKKSSTVASSLVSPIADPEPVPQVEREKLVEEELSAWAFADIPNPTTASSPQTKSKSKSRRKKSTTKTSETVDSDGSTVVSPRAVALLLSPRSRKKKANSNTDPGAGERPLSDLAHPTKSRFSAKGLRRPPSLGPHPQKEKLAESSTSISDGLDHVRQTLASENSRARGSSLGTPRPVDPTKVFGVSLHWLHHRDGTSIPPFLRVCQQKLLETGLDHDGVLRIPGSFAVVTEIVETLDSGGDPDWSKCSVNDLGDIYKYFYRKQPSPIIPEECRSSFLNEATLSDEQIIDTIVQIKDTYRKDLIIFTLQLLAAIDANHEVNRMSASNLATLFASMLFFPDQELIQDEHILPNMKLSQQLVPGMTRLITLARMRWPLNTVNKDGDPETADAVVDPTKDALIGEIARLKERAEKYERKLERIRMEIAEKEAALVSGIPIESSILQYKQKMKQIDESKKSNRSSQRKKGKRKKKKRSAATETLSTPTKAPEIYVAQYEHVADEENELKFDVGQHIVIEAKHESGWWTGSYTDSSGTLMRGVFPVNYTQPLKAQ